MATKVPGNPPKQSPEPTAEEKQASEAWLNFLSPYEPQMAEDEPGFLQGAHDILGKQVHGIHDDPSDMAVHPDFLTGEQLKAADVADRLALLEGFYGKTGQPIRNNTAPPSRAPGPLINTPLPGGHTGPLINTPLPGGHTGPLINMPLGGVPRSGMMINTPPPSRLPAGPLINVAQGGHSGPLINVSPSGGPKGPLSLSQILAIKAQTHASAAGHGLVAAKMVA